MPIFIAFFSLLIYFPCFLTIMNVDIRSMHGGAQHGLRISAFWLLAFGFVLSVASIWFCIASWDLVSGVWFFLCSYWLWS